MTVLQETQFAFSRLPANNLLWQGEHTHAKIRPTSQGIYIGSIPFNPEIHEPSDIDHLSPMGLALGEDYVYQTLPDRGLISSMVLDNTHRADVYPVSEAKLSLTSVLSDALFESKDASDRIFTYSLVERDAESMDRHSDPIEVSSQEELTRTIADIARDSLTFVISDFQRMRFDLPGLNLENIIAVKVNHQYERQMPEGHGRLPLGDYNTVNTDKKRELQRVNEELEKRHMQLVSKLQKLGAGVASVIIEPRLPLGFDVKSTDIAIASAIKSKH